MTTQIVYVLISSDKDLYLEEFWASLFSLRIYHPEVTVKVLADKPTATRIDERPQLRSMISSVVIVDVPEHYSPKERSRQIKTTVRNLIEGPFVFIDTDTVICKPLDAFDTLTCDIAAVPDGHLPLSEHAFRASVYDNVRNIFNCDIHDAKYWFNSGVMYVADTELAREFYHRWNEHWTYSTFKKKCSQDQPALVKTDQDFGYIIHYLPDIYNCQIALSLKFYADAAIVHWWHMDFLKDQSYSPFMGLSLYRDIKKGNGISHLIEEQILKCKSTFTSPSMPVGISQIYFLFSPAGQVFSQLREENHKWEKILDWIAYKILRYLRFKKRIKKLLYK